MAQNAGDRRFFGSGALAALGIVPEYLFFEELELTITGR
jgi:hypothetical protein